MYSLLQLKCIDYVAMPFIELAAQFRKFDRQLVFRGQFVLSPESQAGWRGPTRPD